MKETGMGSNTVEQEGSNKLCLLPGGKRIEWRFSFVLWFVFFQVYLVHAFWI